MTRPRPKPPAETVPEPPEPMPLPTREEFEAECEALANAVAETLRTDLQTKTRPVVREAAEGDIRTRADPDGAVLAEGELIHYPGGMDFVPPYNLICNHAVQHRGHVDGVTVSRPFLDFLLRCLLGHIDFDERQYLGCNPDVAGAVGQGRMHSGRDHFLRTGYFEGRSGGVCVDEAWYLARNPDVAAAKSAGQLDSAAAQYRLSGANEWRMPNPRVEDAVRMWKEVLESRSDNGAGRRDASKSRRDIRP